MRITGKIAAGLIALAAFTAAANADSDPSGVWLTQAGDAKVQVAPCGNALCATIVWLKQPLDPATGRPVVDDKNPDPAKARRPVLGLNLFVGMKPADGKWSGRIYNADDGKTYASTVSLVGAKALKVEGCVLMFCGSETWKKISGIEVAAAGAAPAH
ncbi:MAG: DUF2147 domain-containing protein [Rhodopseudomonas sp.]|uniref:DUF2147 domain-containing protein n=1 Tax=Rhodopseudomonas sp. TaxID=1078 RepID=UPI00185BEE2F|nr:DUF2147 domain-containing protein [Rhodopseudomonas sp.]NVN88684.1 DUF2147 domain-containing protein [Rhodopseudomonas sp.]